jgi:serine phosphatase RsbU (regulator of sigma subunit)
LKIPKGVIRSHKSKNDRQHNGLKKKDIQRSTKHYIENSRSNNKNSTICFACYERSDWQTKVITVSIISLYIHDIRSLASNPKKNLTLVTTVH